MAGGNEIHGLSSNSVAQRNMQPFVPKTFIQKIIACFTQPNIIYMPPDVKVIQEGGEILRILVNKGSERQPNFEITIPSNCTLQQFTSTQDIIDIKVLFGRLLSRTENPENTENRMLNHNSDLKLEKQSCLTKKGRRKKTENTNFGIKSDIQSAKQSCSSSIDNSNFPMLKTTPQLNNTFSDKENDYSNEEYPEENKTVYLRGFPVELTAYSTKKFHLNDNTCLLESVTFRKENRSRPRETLIMFRVKGMLYVPSALLRLYMEIIEIRTNSIDILCISETESDFRLEILPGLSGFSALQFAKRLQMLNNGKGVRKLKELIQYIEIENQTVDDPADIERVKTNDESYFKACYSLNQDLYSKQSRTCKIDDIEDKTAEKINSLQQEIYKNLQDMNFKMEATRDKIHGENSYTKCSTDSKWTDRKKMGNSKVRTQSDQPTWNICLLNREDEAEGLVTEYFGDSMISQAIYEFFGQYIDCEYKGTFERPHVLWPSMHPILPYKFRYLDNRVS